MTDQKTFFLKNKRGEHLHAVLRLPHVENPPLLIMTHGFTDDKTGDNRLFVNFARKAAEKGFAVFRFDFAGSGDSDGVFEDTTVDKQVDDLISAIDYATDESNMKFSQIYLIGYSLGGAISLLALEKDKRVAGFIGWSPALNLQETFKRVLGEKSFSEILTKSIVSCTNGSKQFWLKKSFFESIAFYDLKKRLDRIRYRDIIILQGSEDKKVLMCESKQILENISGDIHFETIEGAGHNFTFYEDELFEATFKHLQNIRIIEK